MTDGGDIRDEAERLVSAILAAASFALRGAGRHLSTYDSAGSRAAGGEPAPSTAECCVCPVCRGIAAVRNPSPQMVFTVAKGATNVASGIASALRAFSAAVPPPAKTPRDPGATWRSATRTAEPPPPPPADDDPWGAATRAAE
jgi:hypothetical protein